MKVQIQNLKHDLVNGVEVHLPEEHTNVYQETYFTWDASPLVAQMNSSSISGGILNTWHHVPEFNVIETHVEPEMFYFVSGVALMLFMDLIDGTPDMASAQIVRVQPGTQLIISAGKAHFVPVAETDSVHIIVVSPKVDAPRVQLPEAITLG